MAKRKKIRVALIFGGRSGEHEVSLLSAASVAEAIDKEKYEVYSVGITPDGRWLTTGDPMKMLQSGEGDTPLLEPAQAAVKTRELTVAEPRSALVPGTQEAGFPQVDVVFPVLHGPYGEDGTIQGLLEMADIPYVGAGVLGSALGMDKVAMKDVLSARGLPVVPSISLLAREWRARPEEVLRRVEREIGYPCFVKPANLGSSVGITKAHDRGELEEGLVLAARYDRRLLVEQGVNAREIEVSVLGNDDPEASVPGEILPCNEFYDYAAKYLDGDSELLIPAPITPEQTQLVRELAIRAFKALDCAGMARADFLLCRDTARIYVNELNTIPGFTAISMYPKLWEASGLPYAQLIDRLMELAIERHEERSQLRTRYSGAKGEECPGGR